MSIRKLFLGYDYTGDLLADSIICAVIVYMFLGAGIISWFIISSVPPVTLLGVMLASGGVLAVFAIVSDVPVVVAPKEAKRKPRIGRFIPQRKLRAAMTRKEK